MQKSTRNSATLRIKATRSCSVSWSAGMSMSGSNLFTSHTRISATRGKFGFRKFVNEMIREYPKTRMISVKSYPKIIKINPKNVQNGHTSQISKRHFAKAINFVSLCCERCHSNEKSNMYDFLHFRTRFTIMNFSMNNLGNDCKNNCTVNSASDCTTYIFSLKYNFA